MNVNIKLKTAEPFLAKDYTIAYDQFCITDFQKPSPNLAEGNIEAKQAGSIWSAKGKNFSVNFNTSTGTITNYIYKGITLISEGGEVDFWRPMTDNDYGAGSPVKLADWRNANDEGTAQADIKEENGAYKLIFTKQLLGGDAKLTQTYVVNAIGTIHVTNNFEKIRGEHPMMPRFGSDFTIPKQFTNFTYYGRGPWENYIDRNSGANIGIYTSNVSQQYFPYARPQESGNKTDVRWATLTDKKGNGIKITGDIPIEVAALHYSINDLDAGLPDGGNSEPGRYDHSRELTPRANVYLRVDYKQMGVAGTDSWYSLPLEQYQIPYSSYSYSYSISPAKK